MEKTHKIVMLFIVAVLIGATFFVSANADNMHAQLIAEKKMSDEDGNSNKNKGGQNEEEEEQEESAEGPCAEKNVQKKIEKAENTIMHTEIIITEKETKGFDVTKALESLEDAEALLDEAKQAAEEGECDKALDLIKEAQHTANMAKSKDIVSVSPRALVARAFGKCISEAAKEKNFGAFEGCHEEYKNRVREQIREELSEEDQEANDKIDEKIDELIAEAEDEEIIDVLEKFKDYTFCGIDADEVIAELDAIFEEGGEISEIVEALQDLLDSLKEASNKEKFNDGIIPFTDTDDDEWFFTYADILKDEACIQGFVDEEGRLIGKFKPGNEVLFGDALKFVLSCLLGEEPVAIEEDDFWAVGWALVLVNEYADYVEGAFLERVESAIEDEDEFKVGLTRGEIIGFIIDILEIDIPVVLESPFIDVPLDYPYIDAIAYAVEQGVVSGDEEEGTFRPNDVPNRAEMVKIIIMAKELL